jgi:hypothetical protein
VADRRTRSRPAGAGRAAHGETPAEALARASLHARRAAAEAAAALRALLDAASLFADARPAAESRWFAAVAERIDDFERSARADDSSTPEVLAALASALDAEIRRWEQRSRADAEARAVLRALLGVRELLWELGVRETDTERPAAPGPAEPARARPRNSARDPFADAAPDLFEVAR